ncbi:hypothetical protein MMC29_002850 [Sticta canariensis]|nr:hypothetical protein [Sticta canariensis]
MSSAIATMSSTMTASATTTTFANRAAFLAATAVLRPPPPGVTPVFDGPNPNGVFLTVVCIVGLILGTTITAMRLWTKGFLMRTAGWDDYTCVVALAGILIWTCAQVKSRLSQSHPGSTSLLGWGRPSYNIRTTHAVYMLHGKLQFMAQAAYLFSIGTVKVSILFMYLRAFTGNKTFKYTCWVLICLITAAHMVAFLGWVFSIIPVSCHWTYYPTDEEYARRCNSTSLGNILVHYSLFLNIFTVILDLVILYLPCKPVWRLQLAKRQRISILIILFAGVIVTVASLLRLGYFVARFYGSGGDTTLTEFRVNLITTIELDIALLCCCLPILKPFLRQYAPSVLRLNTFSNKSKDRSSAHPVASTQFPNKTGRKWPDGSRDEELIGANYLELGEDGKSDQSYVMSSMAIKEGK